MATRQELQNTSNGATLCSNKDKKNKPSKTTTPTGSTSTSPKVSFDVSPAEPLLPPEPPEAELSEEEEDDNNDDDECVGKLAP
eukprot:849550-Amphidinium_carterae.2